MKNKRKKYIQFLLGIGYILILCGCQMRENNHSIQFVEDKVIEYSSDFKVSKLIKSIDGYTQKDFRSNEDDSIITLPNDKTVSINISNKKIKLDTIKFDFKYMGKTYIKEVVIQDTTAPEILCENNYDVKVGNEYFNLKNLIECSDNYTDKEDIEIYFNGTYDINKKGEYKIEVLAYDGKKNKAKKEITVTVKEEEKQEAPASNPSGGSANNAPSYNGNAASSNSSSGSTISSGNSAPQNSGYQPVRKTFTIDTYNSFDECYAACQNYINECMAKGYRGQATAQPIKRDGVYIGYEAVFN